MYINQVKGLRVEANNRYVLENSVNQFRQYQICTIMEKNTKVFHNNTDSNIALQVLTIDLPHHLCIVGRK